MIVNYFSSHIVADYLPSPSSSPLEQYVLSWKYCEPRPTILYFHNNFWYDGTLFFAVCVKVVETDLLSPSLAFCPGLFSSSLG